MADGGADRAPVTVLLSPDADCSVVDATVELFPDGDGDMPDGESDILPIAMVLVVDAEGCAIVTVSVTYSVVKDSMVITFVVTPPFVVTTSVVTPFVVTTTVCTTVVVLVSAGDEDLPDCEIDGLPIPMLLVVGDEGSMFVAVSDSHTVVNDSMVITFVVTPPFAVTTVVEIFWAGDGDSPDSVAMLLRKGDGWIVEKSVDTSLLVPGGALVEDRSQGPPKK